MLHHKYELKMEKLIFLSQKINTVDHSILLKVVLQNRELKVIIIARYLSTCGIFSALDSLSWLESEKDPYVVVRTLDIRQNNNPK